MDEKLKTCPFCGGLVYFNYNGDLEPDGIHCPNCHMVIRWSKIRVKAGEKFSVCMEKLTRAWNQRGNAE